MKYCSICGIEFADSAYRCPSCGAEPANAAQAESAETERVQTEAALPETPRAQTVPAARVLSGGAPPRGDISRKVESHLVKSIIGAVCCCQPFGIVAIVYAAQVEPNLRANNLDAALESSKKANLWGNLAIGAGLVLHVLLQVFFGSVFMTALKEGGLLP